MNRFEKFFVERGIGREVRDARGYHEWTTDDVEPIRVAYEGMPKRQLQQLIREKAETSDGLLMPKYPLPGCAPIRAQMRPWNPPEETTWDFHPDVWPDEWPVYPEGHPTRAGRRVPKHFRTRYDKSGRLLDYFRQSHVNRARENDDHRGTNPEGFHTHTRQKGKYQLPPLELVDELHDHADYTNPKVLAKHLREHHPEGDVAGMHPTSRSVWRKGKKRRAKRRVKDRVNGDAVRLDFHPLVLEDDLRMIREAEVVYFGIEGTPKNDAALQAILDSGSREAVFNVPSVTLWDAPELPTFARKYLRGKTVYVIPDSDWKDNDKVATQALLCRTKLRKLGVRNTFVAAPPAKSSDASGDSKQGVDDFIGGGGRLHDLIIFGREEPNIDSIKLFLWGRAKSRTNRADAIDRDAWVLAGLTLHAGHSSPGCAGGFVGSFASLASAIDRPPKYVSRAIRSLEENYEDILHIIGKRPIVATEWEYGMSWDWDGEPPTIVILPERLRAKEVPEQTIGAYLSGRSDLEAFLSESERTAIQATLYPSSDESLVHIGAEEYGARMCDEDDCTNVFVTHPWSLEKHNGFHQIGLANGRGIRDDAIYCRDPECVRRRANSRKRNTRKGEDQTLVNSVATRIARLERALEANTITGEEIREVLGSLRFAYPEAASQVEEAETHLRLVSVGI